MWTDRGLACCRVAIFVAIINDKVPNRIQTVDNENLFAYKLNE